MIEFIIKYRFKITHKEFYKFNNKVKSRLRYTILTAKNPDEAKKKLDRHPDTILSVTCLGIAGQKIEL